MTVRNCSKKVSFEQLYISKKTNPDDAKILLNIFRNIFLVGEFRSKEL